MKSLAALLRTSGQPLPYEKTRPLELVEIDLDKPGEGEIGRAQSELQSP